MPCHQAIHQAQDPKPQCLYYPKSDHQEKEYRLLLQAALCAGAVAGTAPRAHMSNWRVFVDYRSGCTCTWILQPPSNTEMPNCCYKDHESRKGSSRSTFAGPGQGLVFFKQFGALASPSSDFDNY